MTVHIAMTSEQAIEARGWVADCKGVTLDSVTEQQAAHYIQRHYPGGWDAFRAECCTYVQLPSMTERQSNECKRWGVVLHNTRGQKHDTFTWAHTRDGAVARVAEQMEAECFEGWSFEVAQRASA